MAIEKDEQEAEKWINSEAKKLVKLKLINKFKKIWTQNQQ